MMSSLSALGHQVRVRDRGEEEWSRGVVKAIRPKLRVKTTDGRYAYVWDEVEAVQVDSGVRMEQKLFEYKNETRRLANLDRARKNWVLHLLSNGAANLKRIFDEIDVDKSEGIDQCELMRYFQKKGKSPLIEDSKHLFDEIDANGDGEISFEELRLWTERVAHGDARQLQEDQSAVRFFSATIRGHTPFTKGIHKFPQKSCGVAWRKGAAWHKTSAPTQVSAEQCSRSILTVITLCTWIPSTRSLE
jgi:hypothetical protein